MPFVETYSVKFWNGNLHPHVNPRGWPDMTLSVPTSNDQAKTFPDGSGLNLEITLEHSFCGWNFTENGHTPGAGSLKISRTWQSEVQDHRVYSSKSLLSAPQPVT